MNQLLNDIAKTILTLFAIMFGVGIVWGIILISSVLLASRGCA